MYCQTSIFFIGNYFSNNNHFDFFAIPEIMECHRYFSFLKNNSDCARLPGGHSTKRRLRTADNNG